MLNPLRLWIVKRCPLHRQTRSSNPYSKLNPVQKWKDNVRFLWIIYISNKMLRLDEKSIMMLEQTSVSIEESRFTMCNLSDHEFGHKLWLYFINSYLADNLTRKHLAKLSSQTRRKKVSLTMAKENLDKESWNTLPEILYRTLIFEDVLCKM